MTFTYVLAFLLIVLIVIFVMKKDLILSKLKKEEDSNIENIDQSTSKVEKEDSNAIAIENLVKLNIGLRLSELNKEAFKDLLVETEALIDDLIVVVQSVNEEGKYTEHTPLINRMANVYLVRYISAFVDLPTNKKLEQKEQFKQGLDTLKNSIQAAKKTLENENNEEFIKQMGFVKAFFDGDFNGGKQ